MLGQMVIRMKEYYELKAKIKCIEDQYGENLNKILDKNELSRTLAWLKFGGDGLIIIWEDQRIPTGILNQLQDCFGAIESIQCNNIGTGLLIQFHKEQ